MNDDEYQALLARQAAERAKLKQALDSTREERAEAMAGARSGPSFHPGGSGHNRQHEKQKAMTEIVRLDQQKLATLDQRHAAEQAAAQSADKSESRERSIDMTALQNAAIALALEAKNDRAGAEAEKKSTLAQNFNNQAERDR